MKTKIIIAVLVLIVLISVGGYFTYAHSKKEFFGSATGRIYKPFVSAAKSCEKYKDEEARYENCIKKFNKTKEAYKNKKCLEIKKEVIEIDGSTCKVTYSTDKSSYFSYSCNPRSPEVSKKLREMFNK